MKRNPVERIVQDHLIANNGEQLKKLNKKLILPESEHKIQYGRIDILCYEKQFRRHKPIAIELKALKYSTSYAIGQLTKYLNFAQEHGGQVYFLAPMIKEAIYQELQPQYKDKLLRLYEYTLVPYKGFEFKEMKPKDLNDKREVKWMDQVLKQELVIQNIKKQLNLKDTTHVRNAFEITKFFYNAKNSNLDITQKNYLSKRAAQAGANIIRQSTNKKSMKLVATILEYYSKH